jgi:hypothetical protein
LLKDPDQRRLFLRTGIGWHNGARMYATPSDIPYDLRHNPWGPPKSRSRMAHERPRYPSAEWDWPHCGQTPFYSHNRTKEEQASDLRYNRATLSLLGGSWLFLYSLQIFGVLPASSPDNSQGAIVSSTDANHSRASDSLKNARDQAKAFAQSRREGVKRDARVMELDRQAQRQVEQGHTALAVGEPSVSPEGRG